MAYHVIIMCFLWVTLAEISNQEHVIVQTPSGKVRGVTETYGDDKVYQFRGIPYAKAPIGELRFRKPMPYGSWDYILDATKGTPACMQPEMSFGIKLITDDGVSEDCLVLNIHVPRDVSNSNNKAVMVWIHGGGFTMGQGSWYDGSYLAHKGDVIVVTVNYRLGIFGFLTTMDKAAPGNFGLWDQKLAIEWVRSNIAAFGGNPSLITIFGESAGGFSVSYQSLIPYNKGLFQRVIAQSGVAGFLPLIKNTSKFQEYLADYLQCNESTLPNTFAFIDCLRQKSAEELLNASQTYVYMKFGEMSFDVPLGVCFDGDLMTTEPEFTMDDSTSAGYKFFRSLDYMTGTTDGEGSLIILMLPMWSEKLNMNITEGIPTRVLCDKLAPLMTETFLRNVTGVADALCTKYKVEGGDNENMIEQGIKSADMYSDVMFLGPTVKSLLAHSQGNTDKQSFHYLFTRSFSSALGIPSPDWFKKAGHGMDLLYLFGAQVGADMFNLTFTDEDLILEDRMITYWSNFAKYGNPNGDSVPSWPEYGSDRGYIQLDREIKSNKEVYQDRMDFFLKDIPKIMEKSTKNKHEEL